MLEGVFARGDRRTARVLLRAYELGCLYDSWSETFDNEKWMQAFADCGMDYHFYTTRERSLDEIFPWDFIDTGVTKDFLKREWKNAMGGEGHAQLPRKMFRLRREIVWRRCLL